MTKFSFALVVMFAFSGSLCASEGSSFQDRILMIAPCPVVNGENCGGSCKPLSDTDYAGKFPGAGYIPTAKEAEMIAQQVAEVSKIAAENAKLRAALREALENARALETEIKRVETLINTGAALEAAEFASFTAQSASSSRSGSRPGSRCCMSPVPHAR